MSHTHTHTYRRWEFIERYALLCTICVYYTYNIKFLYVHVYTVERFRKLQNRLEHISIFLFLNF